MYASISHADGSAVQRTRYCDQTRAVRPLRHAEGRLPGVAQPSSANTKVLIVEDDPLTARAVGRLVESLGLVPHVALRAREALEVLPHSHDLRALVVDVALPDGDGFWVAEAARRHAANLPIVILTGSMSIAIVNQSFRLGAQLLAKPMGAKDIASLRLFLLGAPPQPVVERVEKWARDKGLTPRQSEILVLGLTGLDRDAMAGWLGTTTSSVEEHVAQMLKVLTARDLDEILRMLRQITQS
jgi:two-component system, LuxR family, response regulator FixJ